MMARSPRLADLAELADAAAGKLEAGAALLRRYRGASGRTLVLGGVRSGKSRHAEALMARHHRVNYLAAGLPPSDDDPDWAARVAAHRARRPAHWRTVETTALAGALRETTAPTLIDCLGTWVSRVLDEVGAWSEEEGWQEQIDERLQEFVDVWRATTVPVVAVSNEVGSGVVPPTRAGRVFRDVLGALNTAIAAESHSVRLVVAGRIIHV